MTESRVFVVGIVLCLLLALTCVVTREYFGVLGSLLGALNAYAARYFLVRWKPSALVE